MNKPDILQQLQLFYLLEELYARTSDAPAGRYVGIGMIKEDIKAVRDSYNTELAQELWDYLSIICIGEGRHGVDVCYQRFAMKLGRLNIFGKQKMIRSACYARVRELSNQLDPQLSLAHLFPAFKLRSWGYSFGGPKWARITETALLYHETPPSVFIDTVANLEHNTGTCLNKDSAEIFSCLDKHTFKDFLNIKAETNFSFFGEPTTRIFWRLNHLRLPYQIKQLLDRARGFGLIPELSIPFEIVRDLPKHTPIVWGHGVPQLIELTKKEVRAHEQDISF